VPFFVKYASNYEKILIPLLLIPIILGILAAIMFLKDIQDLCKELIFSGCHAVDIFRVCLKVIGYFILEFLLLFGFYAVTMVSIGFIVFLYLVPAFLVVHLLVKVLVKLLKKAGMYHPILEKKIF